MEQDLKLRGLSPATIRNYLPYCRRFVAFFMRSPEELGAAEVRAFLQHQIEVEQLAYASSRQVYAALKFLYSVTLGRPAEVSRIPFPKRRPRALPKVLTVEELTAFFAALRRAKYRALFMTCYAAGLRLKEVCHVQVPDIDSSSGPGTAMFISYGTTTTYARSATIGFGMNTCSRRSPIELPVAVSGWPLAGQRSRLSTGGQATSGTRRKEMVTRAIYALSVFGSMVLEILST